MSWLGILNIGEFDSKIKKIKSLLVLRLAVSTGQSHVQLQTSVQTTTMTINMSVVATTQTVIRKLFKQMTVV